MKYFLINLHIFCLIAAHRASANTLEMIAILKKVKKVTVSDDLMLDTFCYGDRNLSPSFDSHSNQSKLLRNKYKRRSHSLDDGSMSGDLKSTDPSTHERR